MSIFSKYEPIAEAIATLFHPYVEVVIHDTRKNRIAAIYNSFSRRKPGDDSLLDRPSGLSRGPSVLGPFEKRSFDGKRVKYTSGVLRNRKNQVVGLMCINLDVEVFDKVRAALEMFLKVEDSTDLDELFDDDWQERISTFVNDYTKENGLTISRLSKAERIALIQALHEAGGFRAKNSANYVAGVLGISRATVYNDLKEISK